LMAEFQRRIEEELRVRTFPVGVKLLKSVSEAPQNVKRVPGKVTVCQLSTLARLHGLTYLATEAEIECKRGAANIGLRELTLKECVEVDAYVHFVNEEAARMAYEHFPYRLPPKSYEAVLMGPLKDVPIEPDLVLIACNAGQMLKVIGAAAWHDGKRLEFGSNGLYGICGEAIAQSILTGRVSVAFPCWGARRTALYLDDELVGVIPFKIIEEWLEGLEYTRKTGHPYPTPTWLLIPPPPEPHVKLKAKQ
jgi:uncharacterized protein (DUF169 family)